MHNAYVCIGLRILHLRFQIYVTQFNLRKHVIGLIKFHIEDNLSSFFLIYLFML